MPSKKCKTATRQENEKDDDAENPSPPLDAFSDDVFPADFPEVACPQKICELSALPSCVQVIDRNVGVLFMVHGIRSECDFPCREKCRGKQECGEKKRKNQRQEEEKALSEEIPRCQSGE